MKVRYWVALSLLILSILCVPVLFLDFMEKIWSSLISLVFAALALATAIAASIRLTRRGRAGQSALVLLLGGLALGTFFLRPRLDLGGRLWLALTERSWRNVAISALDSRVEGRDGMEVAAWREDLPWPGCDRIFVLDNCVYFRFEAFIDDESGLMYCEDPVEALSLPDRFPSDGVKPLFGDWYVYNLH